MLATGNSSIALRIWPALFQLKRQSCWKKFQWCGTQESFEVAELKKEEIRQEIADLVPQAQEERLLQSNP